MKDMDVRGPRRRRSGQDVMKGLLNGSFGDIKIGVPVDEETVPHMS